MQLESLKEGPTTIDEQQKESPMISIQTPPRPSSESPPSSPQKRQILPQSTMSLLKSQMIKHQVDNAKIDQAKRTMMQSTATKEQKPQASSESSSHEVKKDSMEETKKEETTTCNKELIVADQGVDDAITKSITDASCSQPQIGVATNIPSKTTTPTWIKFDVIGKSGVSHHQNHHQVHLKRDKSYLKAPQKRQILPQSTMSLLKSQVMELQVDNAKMDQAKSTMMESTAIKEHNPQASSDSRGLEDKKDSMEETRKEETTACNKELMADQGVDDAITKSITDASCSQPQTGVATNIPSKPTTPTLIL